MLTPSQKIALNDLIAWVEDDIKESGGCDHESNICFCGVTANVVVAYDILHSDDPSLHKWVDDYEWDENGSPRKILRCMYCYTEKPKGLAAAFATLDRR